MSAPAHASLLDYMERAAATDATVHFVRSAEQTRWSELWRDAQRCAGWIARELPREHVVAGLLEPTRSCLATLLGTWLAGRAFASLPHPSRGMGTVEYRGQLELLVGLVGASVMVLPPELGARTAVPGVRSLTYADIGRARPATGSDAGRLVQFTSGSTDHPCGVVLDMGRLGANVAAIAATFEVTSRDVYFSWLPLSHDMGLVGWCLAPAAAMSPELGGAAQMWLSDPQLFLRDPLSWLRLSSDVGGSITATPNFALDLVARRLGSPSGRGALDLSSLRCVVVGSDTVEAPALRRFTDATAAHGLRPESLCPAYGLAEATLAVTITPPRRTWTALPGPDDELVSLGPPAPGMQVRAGDGVDEPAEVVVRGPSLAGELLGRSGGFTEDGWLRTGDIGFLHEGDLYFTGRTGDRLVVRGRNVDAGSLQRRLGAVEGVRAGCCAAFQDPEGDGYAVAFESVTTGGPGGLDLAGLCRRLAEAATRWSGSCPDRVVVLERGVLPKTPSGKPQAHRLRAGLDSGTIAPLLDVPTGLRSRAPAPVSTPTAGVL